MKKLVLFALLCVSLMLLTPMVSSVEKNLVEDEIEEKYIDIINFLMNIDFSIFKFIILWLGSALVPAMIITYIGRIPGLDPLRYSYFFVLLSPIVVIPLFFKLIGGESLDDDMLLFIMYSISMLYQIIFVSIGFNIGLSKMLKLNRFAFIFYILSLFVINLIFV